MGSISELTPQKKFRDAFAVATTTLATYMEPYLESKGSQSEAAYSRILAIAAQLSQQNDISTAKLVKEQTPEFIFALRCMAGFFGVINKYDTDLEDVEKRVTRFKGRSVT